MLIVITITCSTKAVNVKHQEEAKGSSEKKQQEQRSSIILIVYQMKEPT